MRDDDGDETYPDPPTEVDSIPPTALQRQLDNGKPVRMLDVRDRDEIETWRIDGPSVTRTHVPYAKLMAASVRDSVDDVADGIAGEGPVTVVCGRGEASDYVAGLLVEAGIDARNLAAGMDGWGRLYETRTVSEEPLVVQYRRPATGCLSYAVVSAGEALVVDPLLAFSEHYRTDVADRDADLVAAFDTHLHADHVSGLRELTGGGDGRGTDGDSGDSRREGVRRLMPSGVDRRDPAFAVESVSAGESIRVGDVAVETVPLPGHTTEMTGLLVGGVLIAGDSAFLDGVARPDLQEGVEDRELAHTLYETLIDRLDGLDDPLVAPGHHGEGTEPAADGTYTGRLSGIRECVSAFELTEAEFVDRALADIPCPANVEQILAINRGTETADADEAFELELGPNNCAAAPAEAD
jgi:glyoxylase-like metal-dependent hydrolase (beta-lactamase superfamily II)/rhodanese-related sulfurtransferase